MSAETCRRAEWQGVGRLAFWQFTQLYALFLEPRTSLFVSLFTQIVKMSLLFPPRILHSDDVAKSNHIFPPPEIGHRMGGGGEGFYGLLSPPKYLWVTKRGVRPRH